MSTRYIRIAILTVVYLAIEGTTIYALLFTDYTATGKHLYTIDSIRILGKAYTLRNPESSTTTGVIFEDLSRHNFQLSGTAWASTINQSFLLDTLQYSQTVLTIQTDKEGFNTYSRNGANQTISILGLSIDSKPQISTEQIPVLEKARDLNWTVLTSIGYLVGLLVLLFKTRQ